LRFGSEHRNRELKILKCSKPFFKFKPIRKKSI